MIKELLKVAYEWVGLFLLIFVAPIALGFAIAYIDKQSGLFGFIIGMGAMWLILDNSNKK